MLMYAFIDITAKNGALRYCDVFGLLNVVV